MIMALVIVATFAAIGIGLAWALPTLPLMWIGIIGGLVGLWLSWN